MMILLVGSCSSTFSFWKKHSGTKGCPQTSSKLGHLRSFFFFRKVSSSDCAVDLSCEGSKSRFCTKVVVLQKQSSTSSKRKVSRRRREETVPILQVYRLLRQRLMARPGSEGSIRPLSRCCVSLEMIFSIPSSLKGSLIGKGLFSAR